MAIREISSNEIEIPSGGIAWTTPVAVALADSASLGPLVWAFGFGYAIGTLGYNIYARHVYP